MKRTDKKDDFNTIVQLHKLMNDADNIDITSRESEGETHLL